MDPNEIIKAAPEIAKGAAALGAAIPFTGIVKRMLGPAADEWRRCGGIRSAFIGTNAN